MKYILIIAGLLFAGTLQAQFTGTDSLRNYNNRYITNNPATAFTNLRLHTLLRGMIDYIDTARAGTGGGGAVGVDTLWALNDSTVRYRKNGVFKNFVLKGVYDTRRKVDTAYALNDSTLQIKINGTNRNIILPGRYWDLQGVLNNGSTLTENETITLSDSLTITSGVVIIDTLSLPSLQNTTDTTANKPVVVDASGNVLKMTNWPVSPADSTIFSTNYRRDTAVANLRDEISLKLNSSDTAGQWVNDVYNRNDSIFKFKNGTETLVHELSAGGGGIDYVYSATEPTGSDTMKLWVKTPSFAYVHDVYIYVVNNGWKRFGWLTENGVLSFKRPLNVVFTGQSNAGGIGDGGDTSRVDGIIGYTTGSVNNGVDAPTHWGAVHIGISPFFSDNNNLAHAFAKKAIREGRADIVRLIGTYEGGQNIKRWIDSTGGLNTHYLLDTLRNRLTRSGIDTIDVVLWHQGESGGVTPTANGGYFTDLRTLLDTLYSPLTPAIFKDHTRFIGGGLGDAVVTTIYSGATPQGALTRLLKDNNPLTSFASGDNLGHADAVHFSGTGLDSLGHRYYAAFNAMPRLDVDERDQFTYDYVADKAHYANPLKVSAYNNGVTGSNIQGITLGYFNNTTPIFTLDGSNNVTTIGNFGSWSFTGNPTLKVVGTMGLVTGSNSLRIAGNYNVTGTDLRNTIVANYNTNYNRAAGTTSDNVLIGNDAGYTTTKDLTNSVMIGSDAGEFIAGGGAGDFFTFVGKSAGRNSNSRYTTFIGATTGDSTRGTSTTIVGYNSRGSVAATTYDSSSAFGANARITKSHQAVIGDTTLQEIKIGKLPFKVNSTPSDGQYYAYNNSNSQFELTNAPTPGGDGIYGGDGSLPSDVTVTGGNNSLTLNDIFAFKVNSDYNVIAKADGSGTYTEAILGAANEYWLGYTPTVAVYSKGGAVIIDTNNRVGVGTSAPTAVLHLKAGTASANTAPLKFSSGTNLTTPEAGAVEFDGTNYFATTGSTRYKLSRTLEGSTTHDFGTIANNSSATTTVSVTGAADGDYVLVTKPIANGWSNGETYTAWVSAADQVTVRQNNNSGGSAGFGSQTINVKVIKQ